ncbi:TonB-dependent receptor [Bowmanella sp. Y26]|uniref:TonB-dependent receptor n=1 Tax=Bowmanella yangjiangensis TaxID=2811230 RepID=UPI001BDCB9D7|nr:TonB-dependent receptor [Bowmanella yangjiangensis]MBT1064452.1 TonB-dependent receptor [Bowmanella yangjiangensis]
MYLNSKLSALALSTSLALTSAWAQEAPPAEDSGLEVIMVSAQKRSQSVKDVPISITAIPAQKLIDNNLSTAEQLSSSIANFSVGQTGQGFAINMRGLGSGSNQGFEQTVGTYVDGIYRGRAQLMRSSFLDVERIEVLRGPQSTLFGKNTTAGALNILTAKPTDDLRGYLHGAYELDNGYSLEGAVGNALTDNLQGRVALKLINEDGFLHNSLMGRDEVARNSLLGRVSLAWQPADDVDVLLRYQFDREDSDGVRNAQPVAEPIYLNGGAQLPDYFGDPRQYVLDDVTQKGLRELGEDEGTDYQADHLTLDVQWQLGELSLTSVTGWQRYDLALTSDGDDSPVPLVYRQYNDEEYRQLSQELRLTSDWQGAFNFIAGAYYQETELDFAEAYRIYPLNALGPRDYQNDSDTWALFSQLDYSFNDHWQATLGLRYSQEDKQASRTLTLVELSSGEVIAEQDIVNVPDMLQAMGLPAQLPPEIYLGILASELQLEQHAVSGERTEKAFSPALNIKYKFDGGMLYGAVSTGTKAGGFDARANVAKDWEFEDESVLAYELGAKLTLDDGSADLNLALFNMEFEDLQTSTFDGTAGFFVENGGKSTSRGVELDGRWQFADNWRLSGNLAWLDFSWDEFKGAKCFYSLMYTPDNVEADGQSCDMSGKTGAFAPKWSGSLDLDYLMEIGDGLELKVNLQSQFKSMHYTNYDLNPFTAQSGYGKLNLRVALADYANGWSVALLGKNLTDKNTINYSTDMSFGPVGMYSVYTEQGRSVTLQFGYQF